VADGPFVARRAADRVEPTGVIAHSLQGMASYPGQARCLALGFWPECFRRLDVKGGRWTFPKETRSVLDMEGKHVTIQGSSLDLSPRQDRCASPCADRPYLLSLDHQPGNLRYSASSRADLRGKLSVMSDGERPSSLGLTAR